MNGDPANLIILALAVPIMGFVLIGAFNRAPNLREIATLVTAAGLLATVIALLRAVGDGARPALTLVEVFPGLPIAFEVEPLGALFAVVASGLWLVNSVYSMGYMRGNNEKNQTRFYMAFALSIASTMGIAFAGNMLTLFVFYEVLTLATYPLVTHKGTPEAKAGGRTYLGLLLATSIGFQLVAIVWTYVATGSLDFRDGGILTGAVSAPLAAALLALYMFGIGKAALMPFHFWLPAAMVAPTPVSAFLHAVAVVKAGVFTVLKVVVYIFGIDFLKETGANNWLIWVAGFTIIAAAIVAMTKDNLKARLAYSTVSQLGYVVLGAALASSLGILGGALQIAMHAMAKITLFMCAGAVYVATHKTEISHLDGLGRKMPITFGAFLVASLSIIGLPPFGGAWSKWYLMLASADGPNLVALCIFMASSILAIGYLAPIAVRAFFKAPSEPVRVAHAVGAAPTGETSDDGIEEAPLLCLIPIVFTATGCLVLFFFVEPIVDFLAPITGH